jgi:4-hydroxybenzoate polyprenyltransferase
MSVAGRFALLVNRLAQYWRLARMDKPIGSLLLLWPTLNALWIAAGGVPRRPLLVIFVAGSVLMRYAGCAINDYADRDFDRHVKRTASRPLTSGKIAAWEAVLLAAILASLSFLLILSLNRLTRELSVAAVLIAASYPFTKRFFALPQAYLGVAFGFGIPMGFAAVLGYVPPLAWLLLVANLFWAVAYDTEYAMVDREDDLKIGIRTSALTFGRYDVLAVMLCYAITLAIYAALGVYLHWRWPFWLGLALAAGCAAYHYRLIRERERMACFAAFRHNNWLGCVLFAGIAAQYAIH